MTSNPNFIIYKLYAGQGKSFNLCLYLENMDENSYFYYSVYFIIKKGILINFNISITRLGFPGSSAIKNLPELHELQELQVRILGSRRSLEEGMATHSSILAWRIPWTEEPGNLQSTELQRVGHD